MDKSFIVNPMAIAMVRNPQCIICLQSGSNVIEYKGSCKCRPFIHTHCLNKWFEQNTKSCPLCREIYKETPFREPEECAICMMCCLIMMPLLGAIFKN